MKKPIKKSKILNVKIELFDDTDQPDGPPNAKISSDSDDDFSLYDCQALVEIYFKLAIKHQNEIYEVVASNCKNDSKKMNSDYETHILKLLKSIQEELLVGDYD